MDELAQMTAPQVRRYEQRLRASAQEIVRQVKQAKARGEQMPWMSRETGIDMGYEYERWRRWNALSEEMSHADATLVADLGIARIEYWESALDPENLAAGEPLRAFRPAEPIVRHVNPPTSRPLLPRRSR